MLRLSKHAGGPHRAASPAVHTDKGSALILRELQHDTRLIFFNRTVFFSIHPHCVKNTHLNRN